MASLRLVRMGLVVSGVLLALGGCADDGAVGSVGASSSSSGSSVSTTDGVTSVIPGTTSAATNADTTMGAVSSSTGTATTAGGSSSSGGTTAGGSSSSGGATTGTTGMIGTTGSTSSGGATTGTTGTTSGSSSGGPGCGNGAVEPGEQCDGADLQGFDCAMLGLGGGVLACDPMLCIFDTSGCMPIGNCGNGLIDPGEQCDGGNLQGFDCLSLGFAGGVLACDPVMCTFDTSMCMGGGGTSG